MKKKTPYLDFYKRCLVNLKLPRRGLCNCFDHDDFLILMTPSVYGLENMWYWGIDGTFIVDADEKIKRKFTPLRQTIVLFLAAMNNEL